MNYNSITNAEFMQQEFARQKEQQEIEDKKIKQFFIDTCEKEGFKLLLQMIKDLSLWDKVEENIDVGILQYQRGRRDMWLILRNYVPKDVLAQIEIYNKYRLKS